MNNLLKKVIAQIALCVLLSGCCLFSASTYNTAEYLSAHEAALNGDTEKLKGLIGADPSILKARDYDRSTLLHLSALRGQVEAVKYLLATGSDVNAINSARMTPLHLASKQGFTEVVRALLVWKPRLDIKDSRGFTPLDWAKRAHHIEIEALLRQSGSKE